MKMFKGWIGEKQSAVSMWMSLDAKTYKRFHDVIIPTANGTTQIDHVLVSPFGLFIVETKNRRGWIFGSENEANWTQSLYGRSYSFQNPLRQAFRQKRSLAEFLEVEETSIHTVVYFVGDCQFKTSVPSNVLRLRLGRYVKRFRSRALSEEEIDRVVAKLTRHRADSKLTKREHLRSLKERHGSSTKCPKCGSKLVLRTAKSGSAAGTTFLGCDGYPTCQFTRNA